MSAAPQRKRRATRASFGSVRKLPSGRYQARYSDSQMNRYTAPTTFATKRQAEDWLATTRADMVRGTWRAPELSTMTLATYVRDHLATRLDLAPKTRELYAAILANWLDMALTLPPAPGSQRVRTINLGTRELGSLSVALLREWHAAALHTANLRAAERVERHRQRMIRETTVHAARAWARRTGLDVPDTGRLPVRVLRAWETAGRPPAPVPTDLARGRAPRADAGKTAVAQAYRFLRTVLNQAVREGRILANPCDIAGAGTVHAPERVPATVAELDTIAAAMPDRYAAAVHVAAFSALRAGELFGLTRRQVDLVAGTVRVEHQAVTCLHSTAPYLGPTKTPSSRRTVHLPPHVVAILREHMERFTPAGRDALIFTEPDGRIVTRETRQRAYTKARRAAGRPDLRWHDLRHTGATLAAQAGASLRELQHRLGHSTPRAAMVYQHASAERDRDIARRLSELTSSSVSLRAVTGTVDAAEVSA
ncbi:site-specific integrase [Nocardioides sp. LHD-245]|uniref:tyrosine-type recombinase/integrase n=1 Tax=Nocardioides sp. LHD-245 TaxID=3051387 RepID=UPI0027DF0901|nr:site-specific integrase [Nocardioides sp. LHD-245]